MKNRLSAILLLSVTFFIINCGGGSDDGDGGGGEPSTGGGGNGGGGEQSTPIDNPALLNPSKSAIGVSFTDTDSSRGTVAGSVNIKRADDESAITHYALYWGYLSGTASFRLSGSNPFGTLAVNGSDQTYALTATTIPEEATHIVVFTLNGSSVVGRGINAPILDKPFWNLRYSTGETIFNGLAYGNSIFVKVGSGGLIRTSSDGVIWQTQNSGVYVDLIDIIFDGTHFIATGNNFGTIIKSADGITWVGQAVTFPSSDNNSWNIKRIRYNGSETVKYCAVAADGFIISEDGITWTAKSITRTENNPSYNPNDPQSTPTIETLFDITDLIIAESRFVASGYWRGGSEGGIMSSDDGDNWSMTYTLPPSGPAQFIYINNNFYGFGNFQDGSFVNHGYISSTDGSTDWSLSSETSSVVTTDSVIRLIDDTWVVANPSGKLHYTRDGISWSTINATSSSYDLKGIAKKATNDYLLMETAGHIFTSQNLSQFEQIDSVAGSTVSLNAGTSGDAGLVAVGNSGVVFHSRNGVDWQIGNSGSSGLTDICYGNGLYLITGADGTLRTSQNLEIWNDQNPFPALPFSQRIFKSCVYGGGSFVAVGTHTSSGTANGALVYSPDGSNWTETQNGANNFYAVAYGNSVFLAGGCNTTTDGGSPYCVERSTPDVNNQYPNLPLLIKSNNSGQNWSTVDTTGMLGSVLDITYGGGTFVLVTNYSKIYYSTDDGSTWSEAVKTWSFDEAPTKISYGDNEFVGFSGQYFYTSADGINWTLINGFIPQISDLIWDSSYYTLIGSNMIFDSEPKISPQGGVFEDSNGKGGILSGTLKIRGADQQNNVDSYNLYWGDASGDILQSNDAPFAANLSTAGSLSHTFNEQTIPSGASRFVIEAVGLAANGYGDGRISIPIGDKVQLGWSYPALTGENLRAVAYNGVDTFVAVGNKGTLLTSADGANWNLVNLGVKSNFRDILYENALFVAVGEEGSIYTSADGSSWTASPSWTQESLVSITSDGSDFFTIDENGAFWLSSTDGISWDFIKSEINPTYTTDNNSANIYIADIIHAAGGFVAVGNQGRFYTSSDGLSWIESTTNSGLSFNSAVFFDSQSAFFAFGDGDTVYQSGDGSTWTVSGSTGSGNQLTATATNSTHMAVVGSNGSIHDTTNDGSTWNSRASGTTVNLNGITSDGANGFVVIGDGGTIINSIDGSNWTLQEGSSGGSDLYDVYYLNGKYIAIGNADIKHSTDLTSWTDGTASGSARSLATDGSDYVSVSSSGIYTSTSGIGSWTQRSPNAAMSDVVYDTGGRYVAVGFYGTVLASDNNGSTWSDQTPDTTNDGRNLTAVAHNDAGDFVAVGNTAFDTNGIIIRSTDNGTLWTTISDATSDPLHDVLYDGSQFIAVGKAGVIFTSTDGSEGSWEAVKSGSSYELIDIAYDVSAMTYYILGRNGGENSILTSKDGMVWSETILDIGNLNGITVNNGTLVFVGNNGIILKN